MSSGRTGGDLVAAVRASDMQLQVAEDERLALHTGADLFHCAAVVFYAGLVLAWITVATHTARGSLRGTLFVGLTPHPTPTPTPQPTAATA